MSAPRTKLSWLNVLLHTELATRGAAGGGRVFVRYADLLDDWSTVVVRAGEQLGLQHVTRAGPEAVEAGNRFVDPDLRRMTQTLDDLNLPPRLHELIGRKFEKGETVAHVLRLADAAEADRDTQKVLEQAVCQLLSA